jgi:hypothetical protein
MPATAEQIIEQCDENNENLNLKQLASLFGDEYWQTKGLICVSQ